jgi:hypothetical protein
MGLKGEKLSIFCFNPDPGDGYLDADGFCFSDRPE